MELSTDGQNFDPWTSVEYELIIYPLIKFRYSPLLYILSERQREYIEPLKTLRQVLLGL